MVYTDIRTAFETALYNLDTTFPTAWENVAFTENDSVAHQEVRLVFNRPSNPTLPAGHRRENGEFLVFLNYPSGNATADIYNKAESIANRFKRGTTLAQGSITVDILESPHVGNAVPAKDRYFLAIRIPFSCDVFE